MLEKLNSFLIIKNKKRLRKVCVDPFGGKAEFSTLRFLNNLLSNHSSYYVPKIYEDASTQYEVEMEYIPSITLSNLLAVLNILAKTTLTKKLAAKLEAVHTQLISDTINDLVFFKNKEIQQGLIHELKPILIPYNFLDKWKEAIDYLCLITRFKANSKINESVSQVCSILDKQTVIPFRDASFRNRLIFNQKFAQKKPKRNNNKLENINQLHSRLSDAQYTDIPVVKDWLVSIETGEKLRSAAVNIDFESMYTLTSPEDDFVHTLFSEFSGCNYDKALKFCLSKSNADEDFLNCVILFRGLRETARKIFYLCEHPHLYMVRYRYEKLDHLIYLTLEAISRLGHNQKFRNSIYSLHQLMNSVQIYSSKKLAVLPQ